MRGRHDHPFLGRARRTWFEDGYRYATEAERLAHEAGDEPKRAIALQSKALMAPTLAEALALGEQAAAFRRAGSERRLALLQTSLTCTALIRGDLAAPSG